MDIKTLLKKFEAARAPAPQAPPERPPARVERAPARPVAVWLVYSTQECRGCGARYPSVSPELFVEFQCARGLNWKRATPPGLVPPMLPRRVLQHAPHTIEACPACFASPEDAEAAGQLALRPRSALRGLRA